MKSKLLILLLLLTALFNSCVVQSNNIVPSGLEISLSTYNRSIKLEWDSVYDINLIGTPRNHFNIYRSLDNENNYELLESSFHNNVDDFDIEEGETYYYKISTVIDGLESFMSISVSQKVTQTELSITSEEFFF